MLAMLIVMLNSHTC